MTILSVVIGAFTQQAIQTVSHEKPSPFPHTTLAIAQVLSGTDFGHFDDVGLRASLVAGLAGLPSPYSNSAFDCLLGHCTFPETGVTKYSSAGLSTECIDISSLITQGVAHNWSTDGYENYVAQISATTYNLPNGQAIRYNLGVRNGQRWNTTLARANGGWAAGPWGELDLENVTMTERQRQIISNASGRGRETIDSMIFLMPTASPCSDAAYYQPSFVDETWPMPPVNSSMCPQMAESLPGISTIPGSFSLMAAICYYYPSIQNYENAQWGGNLFEKPVDDPIPLIVSDTLDSTSPCDFLCGFADPCIVDNVVYKDTSANLSDVPGGLATFANKTGPKGCLYGFTGAWIDAFSASMLSAIILATDNLTEPQSEICNPIANYTAMICPRTWWLSGIYNGGNASIESIDVFMKHGFSSLNSQLRTNGVDWDGNPTWAPSISYDTVVYIQFRWEWLLYPLVVVFGTLILLVAIISSSGPPGRKREVIWKDSILPFLFYGLEDGKRKGGAELEPEGALKKAAKPMSVRLTSGDDGWRLHTS